MLQLALIAPEIKLTYLLLHPMTRLECTSINMTVGINKTIPENAPNVRRRKKSSPFIISKGSLADSTISLAPDDAEGMLVQRQK